MKQYTYTGPSGERPYYVYVPRSYRTGDAVPLLVMLQPCNVRFLTEAAVIPSPALLLMLIEDKLKPADAPVTLLTFTPLPPVF